MPPRMPTLRGCQVGRTTRWLSLLDAAIGRDGAMALLSAEATTVAVRRDRVSENRWDNVENTH
jgi:hypothetical protein